MMRWTSLCAAAMVTVMSWPAGAIAQPLNDGFAGADLSAYLENSDKVKPQQVALKKIDGLSGKQALVLSGGSTVAFQEVPVDADTKYTLTFRARFDGGEAAEENPRMTIFTAHRWIPPVLPQRQLRFLDAEGKPINGFTAGMPFRQWHDYRDIFYPPRGAVAMQLIVRSGVEDITLMLDDFRLEETPDEDAINPNPVIAAHGPYNYSGWADPGSGVILEMPDGRLVFDTDYGTSSESFPLSEPGTYSLYAQATGNGYNSVVILRFYDEAGKEIDRVATRRYGHPSYFVLPPGTVRGNFLVYSNLLEEVRVKRMGDQSMITTLQK